MAALPVVEILGGRKVLGRSISTQRALIERLREGLPYSSLESVLRLLDVSRPQTSAWLAVPPRTLARRKKQRRLRADESDRLFRVADVAAHAVQVFGGQAAAAQWLRSPNLVLGGEAPLAALDTELGSRHVHDVLGQIEFGMYS